MNILTAISISKLCQGLQSSVSFDIRETDLTSMRSSIRETDLPSISLSFNFKCSHWNMANKFAVKETKNKYKIKLKITYLGSSHQELFRKCLAKSLSRSGDDCNLPLMEKVEIYHCIRSNILTTYLELPPGHFDQYRITEIAQIPLSARYSTMTSLKLG